MSWRAGWNGLTGRSLETLAYGGIVKTVCWGFRKNCDRKDHSLNGMHNTVTGENLFNELKKYLTTITWIGVISIA